MSVDSNDQINGAEQQPGRQLVDPYGLPYFILFDSKQTGLEYEPLIELSAEHSALGTYPHGFDHDLVPTLKAIWYCLHLPRNTFDVLDLNPSLLQDTKALDFPHHIVLFPAHLVSETTVLSQFKNLRPTIIFYPEALLDASKELARNLGSLLEPVPFSCLSQTQLEQHWKAIATLREKRRPPLDVSPILVTDIQAGPLVIPGLEYGYRLRVAQQHMAAALESPQDAILSTLYMHSFVDALARKERAGVPQDEAVRDLDAAIKEESKKVKFPVTLVAAGVPPPYRRAAHGKQVPQPPRSGKPLTWDLLGDTITDPEAEDAVFSILMAHRSAASGGLGMRLPDVSDETFRLLAQMEDHYRQKDPKPKVLWRLFQKIGKSLSAGLDSDTIQLIRRSNKIIAYSNVPIGLTLLSGDTAPLACQVPILQQPLLPLTRALQFEFTPRPIIYLRKQLRVLIAECLEHNDPIRPFSMNGWRFIQEQVAELPHTRCDIIEASGIKDLNERLASTEYDVLILSAHGSYHPKNNVAGIRIGKEFAIGLEFERVPPLVLMSACHTTPRGVGAISIADMLLRQGAFSVLGTLIPVDVRRNALLMVRLFTYLSLTMEGREPHRTFDEIWHRVMTSNAVNEILSASDSLSTWAHSGSWDESVVTKFMLERSSGRLRLNHIYEDSEQVLSEMANERGFGETFRMVLKSQGYFPESLLYLLLGRPDRIVVADPVLDRMMAAQSGAKHS